MKILDEINLKFNRKLDKITSNLNKKRRTYININNITD
jgi:hypothetical protein